MKSINKVSLIGWLSKENRGGSEGQNLCKSGKSKRQAERLIERKGEITETSVTYLKAEEAAFFNGYQCFIRETLSDKSYYY